MDWRPACLGFGSAWIVGSAIAPPAIAQPIIPANDGTQTRVTATDGNTFVIEGGQRSGDGANLFHSFQAFGLGADQIADFRATPDLQRILTRVTGGNASIIDGLMRVSGGGADLVLMNPAGILFGSGARLDVPGSFTATTATGIGFDGDRWFNVTGPINAAELVGTPSVFRFDSATPGSVMNLGNLAVPAGEQLSLIGGNVLNGGTLSAPEGTLTAIAVPGGKLVRLGQAGHILTLDIPISAIDPATGLSPLSLPELLTGAGIGTAGGTATGTATGTNSATPFPESVEPGTTWASGRWDVSGDRGGAIRLLGDQVWVSGATLDASGQFGGGSVNVGGAFEGGASLPASQRTILDASSVVRVSAIAQGNGGQAVLWSEGVTQFAGTIEGRGGANGGNGGAAEVSGRSALGFTGTVDLSAPLGVWGSLLLDPETIQIVDGLAGSQTQDADVVDGNGVIAPGTTPTTFTISRGALAAVQGNILLEAQQDIQIALGLSLDFPNLNTDPNATRQIEFRAINGNFTMDPSQVIRAPGQNVIITAGDSITLGSIDTSAVNRAGGSISLTATRGDATGLQSLLETDAENGDGGNVFVQAGGNVTLGAIATLTNANPGDNYLAGSVDVTSAQGSIQLGLIDAQAFQGTGGQIRLNASQGGVAIANGIQAFGSEQGGAIQITGSEIAVIGDLNATGGDVVPTLAGTINLAASNAIAIAGAIEAEGNPGVNSLPNTPRVSIVGAGAVTVDGAISTRGIDQGGGVFVQGASLALQSINTSSGVGTGGNVQAQATTGDVALNDLVETSGGVDISDAGVAGTVDLSAAGNLAISTGITATGNTGGSPNSSTPTRVALRAGGSLTADGAITISGPNQGGDLRAIAGSIAIGDVDASSVGTGGSLDFQATTDDLVVGTLITQGGIQAGDMTLAAVGDIFTEDLQATSSGSGGGVALTGDNLLTGAIDTSSRNGAGGDVSLASVQNTEVTTIRAEGDTAGGNITAIAGHLFRATGEFIAQDGQSASLSAIAPTSVTSPAGRIIVQYDGKGETPFVVGRLTENGTLRPLRRGSISESVFDDGEYPVTVFRDGDRLALISVNPVLQPEHGNENGNGGNSTDTNPCPSVFCQSAANAGLFNALNSLTSDLLTYEVFQQKLPLNLAELRQPVLTSEMPDELLLLTDSGRNQDALILVDRYFSQQYLEFFRQDPRLENGLPPLRWVPVQEVQRQLRQVERETRQTIAVIYAMPTVDEEQTEKLQLLFIASQGRAVTTSVDVDQETITHATQMLNQCIRIYGSGRSPSANSEFPNLTQQDREDLENCRPLDAHDRNASNEYYLNYAQSLYGWLIAPLQESLDQFGIDSLVFSLGEGIRVMPLATLNDGNYALINKFNIG